MDNFDNKWPSGGEWSSAVAAENIMAWLMEATDGGEGMPSTEADEIRRFFEAEGQDRD
jgi:hypothetical protein